MPYIAEPTNTPVPFLVPSPLLSQFFVCFFVFALHLRTLSILLLRGFTIRCSMQDAVLLGLCHIFLMDGKRSSGKKKKEKKKVFPKQEPPPPTQWRSVQISLFLFTPSLFVNTLPLLHSPNYSKSISGPIQPSPDSHHFLSTFLLLPATMQFPLLGECLLDNDGWSCRNRNTETIAYLGD